MLLKRALPIFLLAIAALISQSKSAEAITNGEPDNGQHPYVGIAVFLIGMQPVTFCSGTLIAPRIFLTAGHCAFGKDAAWVWFDETFEQNAPPQSITGTPYPHPDYDDSWVPIPQPGGSDVPFPNTHDVGVVVLNEPVDMNQFGELPELGVLDTLSTQRGRQNRLFTTVGYGLEMIHPLDYPPAPPAILQRRKATTMFINLENALTDGYNLQTSGNPGDGQGTGGDCYGDSGGPILLEGTNKVVAIVSFGNDPVCRGPGFNYRTDIDDARSFIEGFLP